MVIAAGRHAKVVHTGSGQTLAVRVRYPRGRGYRDAQQASPRCEDVVQSPESVHWWAASGAASAIVDGVDSCDHFLDIVVDMDGAWHWKDKNVFIETVRPAFSAPPQLILLAMGSLRAAAPECTPGRLEGLMAAANNKRCPAGKSRSAMSESCRKLDSTT